MTRPTATLGIVLVTLVLATQAGDQMPVGEPKSGGVLKRMALVTQIQRKLEEDAARPTMGWRVDRFAHHAYVKDLIPHQVVYNYCRMQEVWLDK
jgi:hypothetical protein